MKTKHLFLLPALIAVLNLLPAGRVTAQNFTTLHSFGGGESTSGLILSGKTLYGATTGTVFAVNTDGSGFTNLHRFTDSASLSAGLILSGNRLYGTTYCTGAVRAMAPSSRSTPIARALRTCIISPHRLPLPTAMDM